MKKTIILSENELHRVIKESVKRMLSEGEDIKSHTTMWNCLTDAYNYALNIHEGSDLYIKAFDEKIFPLIRSIDETLGLS